MKFHLSPLCLSHTVSIDGSYHVDVFNTCTSVSCTVDNRFDYYYFYCSVAYSFYSSKYRNWIKRTMLRKIHQLSMQLTWLLFWIDMKISWQQQWKNIRFIRVFFFVSLLVYKVNDPIASDGLKTQCWSVNVLGWLRAHFCHIWMWVYRQAHLVIVIVVCVASLMLKRSTISKAFSRRIENRKYCIEWHEQITKTGLFAWMHTYIFDGCQCLHHATGLSAISFNFSFRTQLLLLLLGYWLSLLFAACIGPSLQTPTTAELNVENLY